QRGASVQRANSDPIRKPGGGVLEDRAERGLVKQVEVGDLLEPTGVGRRFGRGHRLSFHGIVVGKRILVQADGSAGSSMVARTSAHREPSTSSSTSTSTR